MSVLEISVKQEEMAAAAKVASQVRLIALYLLRAEVSNDLMSEIRGSKMEIEKSITHRFVGHRFLDERTLLTAIGVRIDYRPVGKRSALGKETADPPCSSIDITYASEYLLPKLPIPDHFKDSDFEQFARINGLFNCWPYLRSEADHLSSAMNMFSPSLPLLRIVTEANQPPPNNDRGDGPKRGRSRKK